MKQQITINTKEIMKKMPKKAIGFKLYRGEPDTGELLLNYKKPKKKLKS